MTLPRRRPARFKWKVAHGRGRWNSARSALQALPPCCSFGASRPAAKLPLYPAGPIRPAVLETNRKALIPLGFDEIWFVWQFCCLVGSSLPTARARMGPECFACTQLHCTSPIQGGPGTNGAKLLLMRHLGCMTSSPLFSPDGEKSGLETMGANLRKNRCFQVAVVAHHLPEDSQEIRERSLINHEVGSL